MYGIGILLELSESTAARLPQRLRREQKSRVFGVSSSPGGSSRQTSSEKHWFQSHLESDTPVSTS